jgi:hypothetical protein
MVSGVRCQVSGKAWPTLQIRTHKDLASVSINLTVPAIGGSTET